MASNREILARRNEIAREHGFSGYGQARHYRAEARRVLEAHDIQLGRGRNDIRALDAIGVLIKNVRETGRTGADSSGDLYNQIWQALDQAIEMTLFEEIDDEGKDRIWAIVRSFYPRRKS